MSRFEQAVHYIVDSTSAKPEELGKTKLAKVLFFADLEAFRRTGKPITEATYEKRQYGPMPRELYGALSNLVRTNKIAERKANHFGKEQHQFWCLVEPELSGLTAHDVATLAAMTREVCENHRATSISDLTHNAAWELADMGEEIPLAAFLVASQSGKPTSDEVAQIEAALGA
jgi:uncharacterized phage-associated protein